MFSNRVKSDLTHEGPPVLNDVEVSLRQFSPGCAPHPFNYGRQMRVDLVAIVMAGVPIGVGRRLAVEIAVKEYGESRRTRVELEINKLISAGLLGECGPILVLGTAFESVRPFTKQERHLGRDPRSD